MSEQKATMKELSCAYFSEIDRFAIFPQNSPTDIKSLMQSPYYSSAEYYRYLPINGSTTEEINSYLANNPKELCCEVTSRCNLECKVCIARRIDRQVLELPLQTLETHLGSLSGIRRITITGGEPTLRGDFAKLLKVCGAFSEGVVLSTNGMNPEAIEEAIAVVPNILVAISLHGTRRIHDVFVGRGGAYDRALQSIKNALDLSAKVIVFTTVTDVTFPGLNQLSKELNGLPIIEHRLNIVRPIGSVRAKKISFNSVLKSVKGNHWSHKISIKRREQPFLFVSCLGQLELHHARSY